MATAHDVAAYILTKRNPLSALKLQKLIYYCQAWSLVWDDKPLFVEEIQAWAGGPVIPVLYDLHRGQFSLEKWPKGTASALTAVERETADEVLEFYGDKSPQYLSDLTHREMPWRQARVGLRDGERGKNVISLASMQEYYASIPGIHGER